MNSFFQTEFSFQLPKGFLDDQGNLHRNGKMRLATAKDEMVCLQDPRVQADPIHGALVMLAQVITQLGDLQQITPEQIGNLYRPDFQYLKTFYEQIHQDGKAQLTVQCPNCQHGFSVELSPSGEF
jgi:hypothetical protein